MKKEFTPEPLEKRKAAPSADALPEETNKNGKLTDDELDNVAGGMLATLPKLLPKANCPYCSQVIMRDTAEQLDTALKEHIKSAHPERI